MPGSSRQKAPSAKRCNKTPQTQQAHRSRPLRQKAPSPKGALRRAGHRIGQGVDRVTGQKAPSAKRRIKTQQRVPRGTWSHGCQKAPSAKKCIKTRLMQLMHRYPYVRKHRAPKGALRLLRIRKRLTTIRVQSESTERQKAH